MNISEACDLVNQTYSEAAKKKDNAAFSKLSLMLADFENGLRDFVQETTRDQINQVIKKLESGASLSASDIELMRLWIIGDAEYYNNMENDVNSWIAELNRQVQKINELRSGSLNVKSASTLRALLIDASRTASNIAFFLQQKERVQKFASSAQQLDGDERLLLTQILTSKFTSNQY